MNIVAGPEGRGEAVLIRALEADEGIHIIRDRRGDKPDHELTNGPAKLCQALGVTGVDNGTKINNGKFLLLPAQRKISYKTTERIGIKKDTHRLWRFVVE